MTWAQSVVERSFGALAPPGGLLRDRGGRPDVPAARLACAPVMAAVQAIHDPTPVEAYRT